MERLVVIRGGALGDFILGLPLLDSLRAAFPFAHLTLVAPRVWLPLAWRSSEAQEVVPLDDPSVAALYSGISVRSLRERLHRPFSITGNNSSSMLDDGDSLAMSEDADLVLALFRTVEEQFDLAWRRSGARQVVWYSPLPLAEARTHAIDHLLGVLPPLGIPARVRLPRVELRATEVEEAKNWCTMNVPPGDGPIIALHPGSGGRWKCWPPEHFGELSACFLRDIDARIVLVTGPADDELIGPVLAACAGRVLSHAHALPLRQLAALLNQCSLYIGNDSGITHLAAAAGCATVALFGPTDDHVWAPRGPHVLVLRCVRGPEEPPHSPAFWRSRPTEPNLEVGEVAVRVLDWHRRAQFEWKSDA